MKRMSLRIVAVATILILLLTSVLPQNVEAAKKSTDKKTELVSKLKFKKTKDKTGYVIYGCDSSVTEVYIPATYKGLPVKSVDAKAFNNCDNLVKFTVDKKQKTYYAIDGVLYTNKPVKTLVKFPNNKCSLEEEKECNSYTVPEGTIKIGDYAFAGVNYLSFLHIPEGVTTLGNCVFAYIKWQCMVYIPDSVNKIGKNITMQQKANLPFYCVNNDYAVKYANANNIPCGYIYDYEPKATTAKLSNPKPKSGQSHKVPDEKDVHTIIAYENSAVSNGHTFILSDYCGSDYSAFKEIRIDFTSAWKMITPNSKGKVSSVFPAYEGIFGMGYTEESATLVGYDAKGNVTGIYKVNGDFTFAFPGAIKLGVVKGKEVRLSVIPYEPIFVKSSGFYQIETEKVHMKTTGQGFQYIIAQFPEASFDINFPSYLNCMTYTIREADFDYSNNSNSNYSMLILNFRDETITDKLALFSVGVDYLCMAFENDELILESLASIGLGTEYGEGCYDLLKRVKKKMLGVYYPKTETVNKVTVIMDNSYPTTFMSVITFDDDYADIKDESTIHCLAHEMVHAVDQSIEETDVAPSPWFEGRAEYISYSILDDLGIEYYSYYDTFDWSFLSSAEKKDFFSYYYYSSNRETTYLVGYYFFKYICDTYGENVSAKIMKNISGLKVDWETSEEERAEMFFKCVTDATSATVFQEFVRDVVEK